MGSTTILTVVVLLAVGFQLPAPTVCVPACSDGAVYIGGQCLRFSTDSLSWQDAVEACSSQNGQLATLKDPRAVLDYTENHYKKVEFWAGGSDIIREGTWKWITGEPIGQIPWSGPACSYNQQPDNRGGQDCLVVNWVCGGYDDQRCNLKQRYICEQGSCPGGFTENSGNCFYFSSDSANWSQARNNCKRRGGDLAELGNSAQWILDQSTARNTRYWLGGSDPNHNGDWSWVSGRNLPLSYSFWAPNEPNNYDGNEFCLDTNNFESKTMQLNDESCDDVKPYICKSA